MIARCEQNGTSAIAHRARPQPSTSITPPSSGRRGSPITVTSSAANTGRTSLESVGIVVIAGEHDDVGARVAKVEQGPEHERFGVGLGAAVS